MSQLQATVNAVTFYTRQRLVPYTEYPFTNNYSSHIRLICRQHQISTMLVKDGTIHMLPVSSGHDLDVQIDLDIIIWPQVIATLRSCLSVLLQLQSARRCLPQQDLKTFMRALFSEVDYCCSVTVGVLSDKNSAKSVLK